MARYSSIISNFADRIEAHVASGILTGWKWVAIPTEEAEGQKDFPVARMFMPEITEKAHEQLPIIINGVFKVNFGVSTDRSLGIAAHVAKCEAFADALELNGSTADLLLGGTLVQPFSLMFHGPFMEPNGISMNTKITATCIPVGCSSGGRRP